ncbi:MULTISPECIES: thiamine phosphate synthase [Bombella]|uniref:Thiamine phosphate synthase n=1 Tax=Bombella pollinis TaxID=2967337 RepID=A0ABT3WQ85_9PROT|nr:MULTISPECIES: thiamine phosphate synthase [Bombella]MCT6855950.1 thiamine phosphate synthase [Bombella apis]MCX5620295.1 thiamine phosphate synthase [Bombella pollinis]MUG04941.1 thiamine phosphate synthase [Bombella sp. ESL0378]MUG90490.1 thiamine phosphate synthase [Bombella sp. ESL0385]
MTAPDLYPILPSLQLLTELQDRLPPILEMESVTALRLCFDRTLKHSLLDSLRQMVWSYNVALILAPSDLGLLCDIPLTEIDGLHLSRPAEVKTLINRKDKPKNLQLGCSCLTLDDAMSAGEQGADYISLPATALTAITQWSLFAELPIVAEHITAVEDGAAAAKAGADFLAIPLHNAEDITTRFVEIKEALS